MTGELGGAAGTSSIPFAMPMVVVGRRRCSAAVVVAVLLSATLQLHAAQHTGGEAAKDTVLADGSGCAANEDCASGGCSVHCCNALHANETSGCTACDNEGACIACREGKYTLYTLSNGRCLSESHVYPECGSKLSCLPHYDGLPIHKVINAAASSATRKTWDTTMRQYVAPCIVF